MYGFRKIVDVASGAKNSDNGDWEFYHQCFQRAYPGNIVMMKRKVQPKEDNVKYNSQLQGLLADVEMLKTQHDLVDDKLKQTLTENERLWSEVFDLRERHTGQQSMIVKLLQFFLQLVMNKPDRNSRKRRYPATEDAPESIFFPKRGALHLPNSKSIQYDSPNILEISGAMDPFLLTGQGSKATDATDGSQQQSGSTHTSPPEVAQESSSNSTSSGSGRSGLQQQQQHEESLKNEGISDVQPSMFFSASPRTATHTTPSPRPTASRQGSSRSVKSNKSTPRESPFSRGSNSLPASPFIFPPTYTQDAATIDLSSCISTEEGAESDANPIIFSAKSATLHTPDVKSTALHTPEVSSTVIKKTPSKEGPSPPKQKELSTPVVSLPTPTALTRQTSFRDREELSVNVDNISKSIDMLQDMLNKQEINLDLKTSLGDTPNMTSMQELIKLIHQHSDAVAEEEEEEEEDPNVDIETLSPEEMNAQIPANNNNNSNNNNRPNNSNLQQQSCEQQQQQH